jgi:hypothetical protein
LHQPAGQRLAPVVDGSGSRVIARKCELEPKFDALAREAQCLGLAKQSGNLVRSRSALMMTSPILGIHQQSRSLDDSRHKGEHLMLVHSFQDGAEA